MAVNAGTSSVVNIDNSTTYVLNEQPREDIGDLMRQAAQMAVRSAMTGTPIVAAPVGLTVALEAYEAQLDASIDRLRDEAAKGDPKEFILRFQTMLDNLPDGVNGVIRFRLKANIGLRHMALGDREVASNWLMEAYEEAPHDPRAVSNVALAYLLRGNAKAAYAYAIDMIAKDPSNAGLASYIPQIAANIEGVTNPLEHVPAQFLETEAIVVAEVMFLRQRDMTPDWWERARAGMLAYPASKHLQTLEAFSIVDEIVRDPGISESAVADATQAPGLKRAARVLDEYWRLNDTSLQDSFDDARNALAAAMIAFHLCGEGAKAIELAEKVAEARISDAQIVVQATQVAIQRDMPELANTLTSIVPDDGNVAFQAGLLAVRQGNWGLARERFSRAAVPDSERQLIATFLDIEAIDAGTAFAAEIERVMKEGWDSSRSLVLVSRMARRLGNIEIADKSFERAKELLVGGGSLSARLMVASLAQEVGSPNDVIEALDGHMEFRARDRELGWLAQAHATETPHRKRNLAFFESLPRDLLDREDIARAHASLLADLGETKQARRIFLRCMKNRENDSYLVLRLMAVHRQEGDEAGANRLLRNTPIRTDGPCPENDMSLCAAVAVNGEVLRAYDAAYEIVRHNPANPTVVMGFVSLGLQKVPGFEAFTMERVGEGSGVRIATGDGASRTFVIDAGPEFFGIETERPDSALARLIDGKRKGDTFVLPKPVGDAETWTIEEVASKHLHLQRQIMEQFETRFPGVQGLTRIAVGDDVGKVHELVRKRAETNERIARAHLEQRIPLAMLARVLRGDVPSLAGYLRSIGAGVFTFGGQVRHLGLARSDAIRQRGKGIALDPYTAFIAAEMGIVGTLRSHFGTVHLPLSAIDGIDRMLQEESEKLGREQMTLGYANGRYVAEETTDAGTQSRISHLRWIRDTLSEVCDIEAAIHPDALSDVATTLLGFGGNDILDAALIAAERSVPLLSEDGHYRSWMKAAGLGSGGLWLQPALEAAFRSGHISSTDYVRAIAQLAARRHSRVSFGSGALLKAAEVDGDDLSMLREMTAYLGDPDAEPESHLSIIDQVLHAIWSTDSSMDWKRKRAATSTILDGILHGRRNDHGRWFQHLLHECQGWPPLSEYLRGWLRGHFIQA